MNWPGIRYYALMLFCRLMGVLFAVLSVVAFADVGNQDGWFAAKQAFFAFLFLFVAGYFLLVNTKEPR